MELSSDDPLEASPSISRDEKFKAEDLFNERWFFGNLLGGKPRMSRWFSDPSSNASQEMFKMDEHHATKSKGPPYSVTTVLTRVDGLGDPDRITSLMASHKITEEEHPVGKYHVSGPPKNLLNRAPSLPSCINRDEDEYEDDESESEFSMVNLIRQASFSSSLPHRRSCLIRAPSLPPCVGREEAQREENEFSMGKLIRQASLKSPEILPPRHTLKVVTRSCSTSRHRRLRGKQEADEEDYWKKERIRFLSSQGKMRKSLSDIDEKSSRLNLKGDDEMVVVRRRTYAGDHEPLVAGVVPEWSSNKQSAENMKAKIKFWARAVAHNVRQEC